LDLDEMIHNLEVEKQRIQEALDILRRLHEKRRNSVLNSAINSHAEHAGDSELDNEQRQRSKPPEKE
jgi:hypothetical protein